ncbi:hypothetical protein ARMSODRAFT_346842 [Armillaria solidipes]|uniref:Uncharacterized protein n=1 Tax=Armillaria solidipes TaxID=1076256 RepID=A0A2H3B7J1_9AGAR|nr:hypothetical protein ARMSODRAFT_346842 [Armillaria solidipes]
MVSAQQRRPKTKQQAGQGNRNETQATRTTASQHTISKQCGGRGNPRHHHRNQSNERPNRRSTPLKTARRQDWTSPLSQKRKRQDTTASQHTIRKWCGGRSDTRSLNENQSNMKTMFGTGNKRIRELE